MFGHRLSSSGIPFLSFLSPTLEKEKLELRVSREKMGFEKNFPRCLLGHPLSSVQWDLSVSQGRQTTHNREILNECIEVGMAQETIDEVEHALSVRSHTVAS